MLEGLAAVPGAEQCLDALGGGVGGMDYQVAAGGGRVEGYVGALAGRCGGEDF